MTTEIAKQAPLSADIMQSIVTAGDLSGLSPEQLVTYYNYFCNSLGLNPATQPFTVMVFKGKKVLYPGREASAQLSKVYSVSHRIDKTWTENGCYFETVTASTPDGRSTTATGGVAVSIGGKLFEGEAYANAIMKAGTKAKRRATLDLLGLGMLDAETEADVPENNVRIVPMDNITQVDPPPADKKKRSKKEMDNAREEMKKNMVLCLTVDALDELQRSDMALFNGNAEMLEAYTTRRNQLKVPQHEDAVIIDVTADLDASMDLSSDLDSPREHDDIYKIIDAIPDYKTWFDWVNSIHAPSGMKVVDFLKGVGGELLKHGVSTRDRLLAASKSVPATPAPAAATARVL